MYLHFKKQLLATAIVTMFPIQYMYAQTLEQEKTSTTNKNNVLIKASKIIAPNIDGESKTNIASATSDTASLLRDISGMSLYGAGGVSSLPALNGIADDRLRIKINGMDLISSCANHMNPPLSYIDPSNVGSIQVFNGVAPVSSGGDSIGGTIKVNSASPIFAKDGQSNILNGQVSAFYRSNGNARGTNLNMNYATESTSLNYTVAVAKADNYFAAKSFKPEGLSNTGKVITGKEIASSAYQSENHSLNFATGNADQLFEVKLGYQDIPMQGFPNQRMDMTRNLSQQANLHYRQQFDWGNLDARIYHELTKHKMNFGVDKQYWYGNAPGMPMETVGRNTGATIKSDVLLSERDKLIIGSEVQYYRLNDFWNASGTGMMMAPNTFINIKDGERNRFALFSEWESNWSDSWFSQLGIRTETVDMLSGKVAGYNNMAYGDSNLPTSIPGKFNASDREKRDRNIDITTVLRYTPNTNFSVEGGYALKTRSPNLYERYTWANSNTMVMNMNNWFGDGNGYVGNLQLKPEVAQTISASLEWKNFASSDLALKISPFYTEVRDYIDAVACVEVSKTCTTRMDGFANLSLSNQEASLYGIDLSAEKMILKSSYFGDVDAKLIVNYVHGENKQTHSGLYNVMPLNAKLSLQQQLNEWTNTAEFQVVDAKTNISSIRRELKTPGYALFNLRSSYELKHGRIDFGVENLTNRFYLPPLGGAYLGQGATMGMGVLHGTVVAGIGRSFYVSGTLKF